MNEAATELKSAIDQHCQNMCKALRRLKALGDKVQKQPATKKLGGQIKWLTDVVGQEWLRGLEFYL